MRKYLLLLVALCCALAPAIAQVKRCGTMGRVHTLKEKRPFAYPEAGAVVATPPQGFANSTLNRQLNTTVTIPIVVHIVLPNPWLVTDADVLAQVARLNEDFSGLNPDSTNLPSAWMPRRGHSNIRFCLAKRTPAGALTSGIERRVSTAGSNITADIDPIKYDSLGGLNAWDPTRYLNYWVGADATGNGVLGYAQFPAATMEPPASDGVVINYQAWGTNPCYTLPSFNKGRTAVHETGHYLGLLHPWGDDGGSCTGDDFANLTTSGSACSLPPGLFNPPGQGNTPSDVGDTPNQGKETNGCPTSATVADSCSRDPLGIMFQNLMDYSNDACLTMFTKKQVERMEWVLANCRSGLLASNGCQLPASPVQLDATPVQSVNPGGVETVNCNNTAYSSVLLCAGNLVPRLRIENRGLATLTSVTVGYRLNNGAAVSQAVSINLASGATTVVSLPAVALPAGNNSIKFFTANPNGAADQVPANDTLTQTVTVLGSTSLPVMVDFETLPFPPAGWAIDNYNGDVTWERKSPGRNSNWSMFINNYEVDATQNLDDLKSPRINTTGSDSVIITFDLAHKYYQEEGFSDTLAVLVSKDCGATYQTVYKKWGVELATAGTSNSSYDSPAPGDWRTERIGLSGGILSTQNISVIFRNISRFGNNLFIDNINIIGKKVNSVLQRKGYQVMPTIFNQSFSVVYARVPEDLRSITVYNSIGQLVYQRQLNSPQETFYSIDLFGKSTGAYILRLGYADSSKDVSQWVFKQ